MPGIGGWAILLALADLRGTVEHNRMSWAVTGARAAAVVGGSAAVALGAVSRDPMVIPLGVFVAAFTWLQAGTARKVDLAGRFFARHTAVDLARPLTAAPGQRASRGTQCLRAT